jgi:hypothetical protein
MCIHGTHFLVKGAMLTFLIVITSMTTHWSKKKHSKTLYVSATATSSRIIAQLACAIILVVYFHVVYF